MHLRFRLVGIPLVIIASSCGRVGYDEIVSVGGPSSNDAGGARGGPDSGSATSSGGIGSGSGGASTGGTAAGGTDSGSAGAGGTAVSGGAVGSGGAIGSSGAVGSGGAVGGGGTSGNDAGVGSGGTADSGGIVGSGGTADSGGGVFGDAGIVGCADGQREGFLDLVAYPAIAACAGGFALPGVVGLIGPACGRTAGDDSVHSDGSTCNALDLCAVGFHICSSAAEVASKSATGCTGAAAGATPLFFVTAQSGPGARACGATGTDDIFGCGSLGARPVNGSNCMPLDKWSTDLCGGLVAPWACGSDPTAEAVNVVKPGSAAGGVLCCQD